MPSDFSGGTADFAPFRSNSRYALRTSATTNAKWSISSPFRYGVWNRLLGGFEFGLNPAAQTGFLQDYLPAGNVYLAIGDDEEFGGKNTPGFSMAGTLTGATVTIGGKTVLDGGRFVS